MKKRYLATFGLCLFISANALATICAQPFGGAAQVQVPQAIAPRAARTQLNAANSFAPTTATREKKISASVRQMSKDVIDDWSTPLMEFFPASKVKTVVLFESGGYGSGEITRIQVGNLGASGILEGTLLLPVSGHVGPESARRWATTDTYNILIDSHGGANYKPNYHQARPLVSNAKSLDIVTVQELQIPLIKGEPIGIFYDRSGSAGPEGFIEGRALEIVWDGT